MGPTSLETHPPPQNCVRGRRVRMLARETAEDHSPLLRMESMSCWEWSAMAVVVQLSTQVYTQGCKVSSRGRRRSSRTGSAPHPLLLLLQHLLLLLQLLLLQLLPLQQLPSRLRPLIMAATATTATMATTTIRVK